MERISGTLCVASRPKAAAAGKDRDPAERPPPATPPKADAASRKAVAETERARQDMLSEGAPAHDRANGARQPPT